MAEFQLETARLILRDWREKDWAEFFRVTGTPAVMRWLGQSPDAHGQAQVRTRVENSAARLGHCFWVVERKPDGGHLARHDWGIASGWSSASLTEGTWQESCSAFAGSSALTPQAARLPANSR
jgi:RimJ/RimL family protein N-acetyltransferase